jgi:ketosteroid isomerase-like protein
MSQENVEVVAGYFEADDLAASIDALAENVTFVFHGETRHLAGAEAISGKSAAVAWLADWFSRFDRDYRFEIEESLDWDDHVLVVTTSRGTGRASGVPISRQTAQLITLRDGKIVQQDFFASRAEALEGAGAAGVGGAT